MRLEPCAVKVASTVLRGGSGSNATSLPDLAKFFVYLMKTYALMRMTQCFICARVLRLQLMMRMQMRMGIVMTS